MTFQIVRIKSRAVDSESRYPRVAAFTTGTAVVGLGADDWRRVKNLACLLLLEKSACAFNQQKKGRGFTL